MMTQHELEREIAAEIAEGERTDRPIMRLLRGIRRRIERRPGLRRAYRTAVAVLGGLITTVGLLLVPLPGPGWLVVFLGLAILGTEFVWAKRVAAFVKRQLARFWAWWQTRRLSKSTA
ncbi:TIGR02611 family protein [Agromyces sp. NPDC055520]